MKILQQELFFTDDSYNLIKAYFATFVIDLYKIYVYGSAFSATTTEAGSPPILDTQLALFNSTGLGVLASDNASGNLFNKSTILGTAGIYYVGVSAKGYNPVFS